MGRQSDKTEGHAAQEAVAKNEGLTSFWHWHGLRLKAKPWHQSEAEQTRTSSREGGHGDGDLKQRQKSLKSLTMEKPKLGARRQLNAFKASGSTFLNVHAEDSTAQVYRNTSCL